MSKPSASPFPLLPHARLSGSGQSRSASVVPPNVGVEQAKDADQDGDKENVDDKVYCICRSQYEEGRVMIACDRYESFKFFWLSSMNICFKMR